MATPGGLTTSELLTWIASLMGSGGATAVLVAWLGSRRAAREAPPGTPPVLPPEARAAIGCGLADRLSIERIERIEDLAAEQARATERMFALLGRQHGETAEQLRRLGDRVDRGIDEARDGRRAIEDGLRDLRDQMGRG